MGQWIKPKFSKGQRDLLRSLLPLKGQTRTCNAGAVRQYRTLSNLGYVVIRPIPGLNVYVVRVTQAGRNANAEAEQELAESERIDPQ